MAGIVQLEIIDGSGTPTGRAMQVFSTTGTINGDLYPMMMIVGNDGVNPTGPANPMQITGSLVANQTVNVTGGSLTSAGNVTVTATPANMTVLDATVAAAITAASLTPSQIRLLGTTIGGDSGNLANTTGNATLAATGGKTTYLNDVMITAAGATTALAVTGNITGLLGGTKHFTFVFPAGNATAAQPFVFSPPQPLPASAANTTIVVNLPASGAGGLFATVTVDGFQL